MPMWMKQQDVDEYKKDKFVVTPNRSTADTNK